MKAKISKLDKYSLEQQSSGLFWQDYRDDTGMKYDRLFHGAYELGSFLEEYFGLRMAKRIWKEHSHILPPRY